MLMNLSISDALMITGGILIIIGIVGLIKDCWEFRDSNKNP